MKVKEKRKIYITLNSKIPPKIKMPNLINGSVKNAQLILKSYDLKLGKINYVPDMAVNAVIKMYIKGDPIVHNDIITKGSTIDLDVGDGYGNQIFETPDYGTIYFEAKEEVSLDHPEHNKISIPKGVYTVVHERQFNPFEQRDEDVFD